MYKSNMQKFVMDEYSQKVKLKCYYYKLPELIL